MHHEVGTHSQKDVDRRALKSMPTCLARPRASAIAIDGQLDPSEWDGLKREDAVVLGQSPYGDPTSAPKSYAWIRRDDECLYIALLNEVNGDKPLVKGKSWWQSDMVEVIIEGQTGVNTQGWWPEERELGPLFYLVGNFRGEFDSIQIAGLPRAPAEKLRRTARYGARVRDASCWTAEWRIPFASVCLDSARSTGCCFNTGVGKPGTPEGKWAVWVGTEGPNWEVWNAGRLLLRERGR